jgi:hypothetical protein
MKLFIEKEVKIHQTGYVLKFKTLQELELKDLTSYFEGLCPNPLIPGFMVADIETISLYHQMMNQTSKYQRAIYYTNILIEIQKKLSYALAIVQTEFRRDDNKYAQKEGSYLGARDRVREVFFIGDRPKTKDELLSSLDFPEVFVMETLN